MRCSRLSSCLRRMLLAMLLAAVFGSSDSFAAAKRIYIANDDHTDYMWSGDDVQHRVAFLAMLDYYMTQAEATATNAPDARGRFNCDGWIWVREFERNKSAAQTRRLFDHVRAGNISVPLNVAALCYGGMPAEAVLRSMYEAGRLERRENVRFPLVSAMENQTLPAGLASLWAGSGALYSWRGVCGCASRTSWGLRPREIYHFRGPDGQSVCLKWNTMRGSNTGVGGYAEARSPSAAVTYLDADAAFLASWPWPVSAAFGYGWDDMQSTTTAFVSASQTMSNANRRVIVSNQKDFFEDFLASHSAEIPTFSGSFGNEWDLYSASMGEVTADFKRQVEALRTAEALATVASLLDPGFMSGRTAARDDAFYAAGMYYEHDWTADGAVTRSRRAQFQRDMLAMMKTYVTTLRADALAAVAGAVAQPGGSERHIVFNPLSSLRTDVADLATSLSAPLHVVDVASGQEVRSQAVTVGGLARVRILAAAVPSVGYRVYEVRAGAGASFPAAATVAGATADNGVYAVTLGARGQVSSLKDRRDASREYVASGYALHDLGSGNGAVTVETTGPVSTTLRVTAGGSPAHETRVTLHAGLDRVEIEGTITQNFSSNLSYASRFALTGATMRHEEVGMIARVARAAQGGDYADQNARTDWLTMNHFVDLSEASRGITLSNWDSPFFQAGSSTVSTLDTATPSIRACVGMQVDGASYGIASQGGDTRFTNRFALRAHGAYDPAAAMRFALEHQNPLVVARVTGAASAPLASGTWSMLALPSNDVLLWALKPAEEGIDRGVIARVWNVADGPRSMSLSLPAFGITQASRATHIETDLAPASLSGGVLVEDLARQQLRTFRLFPGPLQVVVGPAPPVPPAFTSGPTVTPGSSSAVVQWTTNEPSRGAVRYGVALAPGDSTLSGRATSQSVTLSLLLRGQRYDYRVAATDDSASTALSPPDSFFTLPNRLPVAVMTGTPLTGLAPLTVQFGSTGSSDADGDSLAAAWSYGDAQGGSGASPSHTYANAGIYSVVLTMDDGYGGTAFDTVAVNVSAGVLAVNDPSFALSFRGAEPNPARRGAFLVSFTLPDETPASLEVHDISGRRVARWEIGTLGAGRHRLDLARGGALAPGVYLVRLVRGGERISRRAVLLD